MVCAGVDKVYNDLILNHALQGMYRVYINPPEDTIRQAMGRYTAWLISSLQKMPKRCRLPKSIKITN
jgi:hypothetical protein